MINLTSIPIVSDRCDKGMLMRHMRSACSLIEENYRRNPTALLRSRLSMAHRVIEGVTQNGRPCVNLVQSMCEMSDGNASFDDEISAHTEYYNYAASGATRSDIRSFCRLALYYAWCEKSVLLPVAFKMRRSVPPELRQASSSRVLKELANFEPSAVDIKIHGIHIKQWIQNYSLSWIHCTNWIDSVDICGEEAGRLHAFMSFRNKQYNANPSSVQKAIAIFVDRGWISLDLRDFEERKSHAMIERVPLGGDAAQLTAFSTPRRRTGRSHFFIHPQLEEEGNTPDSETVKTWDRLFCEYFGYREDTGRSANNARKKSFHVLCDYLAIALPLFAREASDIRIPKAPKEFTRYPFVDQTMQPRPFPTFPDYLKRRGLAASSRQSHLYVIKDFFDWVETTLGSEQFSDIAGPGFRSPFHVRDFPFVPRPTGTNKLPFAEEIYPLLFRYAYEVEQIGMFLEAHPTEAREVCKFTNQVADKNIELSALGPEFSIVHQDEVFRLTRIPQRVLVGSAMAANGINLSMLRMLIFILETGLRGQSAQWLDRRKWSVHLHQYEEAEPIKMIHINTDKTQKPIDIRVLSRVVDLLHRQCEHLKSKGVPEIAFDYEGRPSSPFDPVVPLFPKESGAVCSDSAYTGVWNDLLFGFQGFLWDNRVEARPVVEIRPPQGQDDGKIGRNGLPRCNLTWAPIHTPHSARSSFVTRRAGSTEYVVLAELIGHADPIVTAYYDVPDLASVIDILRENERPTLDVTSPDCELRTQLTSANHDAGEVIRRFGISSLQELHGDDSKEGFGIGVDLLKSSQVSELIFRDTHICPVGELCPNDVVVAAGAPLACGTCKLACKSVDHLPAIEAKCRALTARIQHTSDALRREKQGRRDEARQRQLQRDLMADSYQLVGWQDAAVTLRRLLAERRSEGVVTGSPEIIRRHLQHVVRQVEPAQFIAERILDAKMYPSMSDAILQRQAQRLARQLAMSETEVHADENEEVFALYSLISSRLRAAGMTWERAGEILESEIGDLRIGFQDRKGLIDAGA